MGNGIGVTPFELLLLAGLVYLIYKVNKLERMLDGGARRRTGVRTTDGGKVIPILKDHIEPGPFKPEPAKPEQE